MTTESRTPTPPRTRILLSEGASTSAREAITALGLKGCHVEICDPDAHCLGRFSRLVQRFHRCPGLGVDPEMYLAFILGLISSGRFDVLLPIHEQGYLFASIREQISPHVAVALPSFESYDRVHNKIRFSQLLTELGLPQPDTRFLQNSKDLAGIEQFPLVLKTSVGTASRGTWIIRNTTDLAHAMREIDDADASDGPLLLQELIHGSVEHAQAIFCEGRLVGVHMVQQLIQGAGGGPALKQSIRRPEVRAHLMKLGERLRWHGALSVDYIVGEDCQIPLYIDCNPRLVEPMSAWFAGLDLTDLLVRVSLGEAPPGVLESREGVRTHLAIQALLGCALRSGSRWEVLRECCRLIVKRGPYAGSREELTPAAFDWLSVIPAVATALWLLAYPAAAFNLPRRGWGSHLLTPSTVHQIRRRMGATGYT